MNNSLEQKLIDLLDQGQSLAPIASEHMVRYTVLGGYFMAGVSVIFLLFTLVLWTLPIWYWIKEHKESEPDTPDTNGAVFVLWLISLFPASIGFTILYTGLVRIVEPIGYLLARLTGV